MKKVLFLLLTFLVYSSINAQIMFITEYFGTSGYRMTEGDTDQKVGDSKGSAVVYQGGINIPLSMKSDENDRPIIWAVSLGGAYAKLDNRNFTEPFVIDEIMNIGFSISHLRPLSGKWSILIAAGAGIYMPNTRFSQINYKNILGNMGVIFIHHFKSNLELGGGLAMNNSFGYPMLFPAIYFNWKTEGRYTVKIAMLKGIEISAGHNIHKKLSLNFIIEMNGQMALLEQEGKNKIFTHQYIVTGIRPEIKIGKRLSIPITAGIHAMRPAEMVDRKLKSMFQDKGYYFQIAPYVSTGLQIGF